MSNTYLPILEQIQQQFGGSIHNKARRSGKHRQCWQWCLYGPAALELLALVYPYLIEKKDQAGLILAAYHPGPKNPYKQHLNAALSAMKRETHEKTDKG